MTAEAFVYAHILENMFNSQAKPFYNSAQQKHLERIDKDKYTAFAINQFRLAGRELKPEAAALAYDLFEGHTYYVHNVLHNAFAYLEPQKILKEKDIHAILSEFLEEKAPGFASVMNRLNYQQKEVFLRR